MRLVFDIDLKFNYSPRHGPGTLGIDLPSIGIPFLKMSPKESSVSLPATAAYASGSFGTGMFSTVPTILLLYFCTETLRMAAGWAAAVVLIPKVWAIAWDPLVGIWSDRTTLLLGRRRPFLITGALGVGLAFVGVFSPPSLGGGATIAWMAMAYFLLATLYSVFAVPYVAIPSEVGKDADTRARLVAWRMVVAMVGVLSGAGLVPLLIERAGGGRLGYERMSLWVAGACAITMMAPVVMMQGRDRPATDIAAHGGRSVAGRVFEALGHRQFSALSCAYLLQLTAVGVLSASTPYLVTIPFGRGEGDIGTVMLGMLGATTLSTPLWAWAGRRYGTARMLVCAIVWFSGGAISIGMLALRHADWTDARVAFALTGIPFAGMQVLPYTIVAHLIHDAASGQAGESSFSGLWTAAEKLGLALGPALTGVVLALARGPTAATVGTLVSVGPTVLGLISLPLLYSASRVSVATAGNA
jgi:glycoside/pentoside/hexuronide:cation symporter, GPH family